MSGEIFSSMRGCNGRGTVTTARRKRTASPGESPEMQNLSAELSVHSAYSMVYFCRPRPPGALSLVTPLSASLGHTALGAVPNDSPLIHLQLLQYYCPCARRLAMYFSYLLIGAAAGGSGAAAPADTTGAAPALRLAMYFSYSVIGAIGGGGVAAAT